MYNEEIKKQYIEDKTNETVVDPYYLPNLFKRTEEHEEKLGKDISAFTTQEIENLYKTMDYRSLPMLCVDNSGLTNYANWCLERMMIPDLQNHFMEFSRSRLMELLNKNQILESLVDYDTMKSWVRALPNPSDGFVLYALFYGIYGHNYKEIWSLTRNDIDLEANTIRLFGRGIKVYPHDLCILAVTAAETEEYVSMTNNNSQIRKYAESDKVIKDTLGAMDEPDDFRRGRRVYHKILRSIDYLGKKGKIKGRQIIDSGCFHMIRIEAERLGIGEVEYVNTHLAQLKDYYEYFDKNSFLSQYNGLLGD